DRVNAVNSMLLNTRGEVRLTHHPCCDSLRRDFETVTWSETVGSINKNDGDRTHATDALGYFIASEFQLKRKRVDPLLRYYK
ncbi:MAG: hypothetical protein V3T30_00980, partial [Thermodesulfobacteriota bacterium]